MVSSIARWLVRMQCYYLSGVFITLASKIIGSGCKISYDKNGYWKHTCQTVIINEAFPNIRMDAAVLQKFNEEVYFFNYRPREKDVCVDVGAGIGTETIFISREIGNSGKIYAIEASPFTYSILKANVLENGLPNVTSANLAISDQNGKIKISDIGDDHISNSIRQAGPSDKGIDIEALTMDDFIRNNKIERIDYLKVNIEGAEKLLIKSFKHISIVRNIAISCHDFLGQRKGDPDLYTKDAVTAFLRDNGFQIQSRNTGTDYADDWIYGVNERASVNTFS